MAKSSVQSVDNGQGTYDDAHKIQVDGMKWKNPWPRARARLPREVIPSSLEGGPAREPASLHFV